MATMYLSHNGNAAVTHESDDTRPGKALCGRSIVGALNLSEMSGWDRMGFIATSNGPCANCSRKLQTIRSATPVEQAYSGPYVAAHIVIGADGIARPVLTSPQRVQSAPARTITRGR